MGKPEVMLNSFFSILLAELESVSTTEDCKVFAVQRLGSRMRKRARLGQQGLREQAVNDFVEANERIGSLVVNLADDVARNARHFITVVLERFNARLSDLNIQETLDPGYMRSLWSFGPGASNGVRGTHTAEKIVQPMTCVASSVPLIEELRRSNLYFRLHDSIRKENGYMVVEGSRLTTVPKNEETERTIAIEPSGSMALQLCAGNYLRYVLKSIGLDISSQQPLNRQLALAASVNNHLATIDLKSASDSISPELVRLLMPKKWYDYLMAVRSQVTELPNGETVELKMISTMGNGFTFPLMTLLLVSLIYGYRCTKGGPNLFMDWSSTAVYGDDIIIPVHEYDGFVVVLQQAGFVVNLDKSYSDGPFRESCGGDYFKGYNVSPFYVRDLSTDSAIYTAINQVLDWSARNELFLSDSVSFLIKQLSSGPYFVPEWLNPDQGILTQECPRRFKYLKFVKEYKVLDNSCIYAVMLASGGYIEGRKDELVYLPRPFKTRYKVRQGRLPRGYLTGWDPSKRSQDTSRFISLLCSLLDSSQAVEVRVAKE